MAHRKEIIGDATLYLGDCLEIMAEMPAGSVDAVVTDPPYGIKNKGLYGYRKHSSWKNARKTKDYGVNCWDSEPASQDQIDAILNTGFHQIIFGGNYFNLPPSPCFLVWDKMMSGNFSDCELAWTNLSLGIRKFQWLWSGYRKQEPEERTHPTQKPVALIEWCLGFLPDARTILDPFMGSGTTDVACMNLGRKFIGIEIEPKYFDIACRRIDHAASQERFDFQERAKPEQTTIEGT